MDMPSPRLFWPLQLTLFAVLCTLRAQSIDYTVARPCSGQGAREVLQTARGSAVFQCRCNGGFAGENCQFACPYSNGFPCSGRGECVAGNGTAACVCWTGWSGVACDVSNREGIATPAVLNGTDWISLRTTRALNGTLTRVYLWGNELIPQKDRRSQLAIASNAGCSQSSRFPEGDIDVPRRFATIITPAVPGTYFVCLKRYSVFESIGTIQILSQFTRQSGGSAVYAGYPSCGAYFSAFRDYCGCYVIADYQSMAGNITLDVYESVDKVDFSINSIVQGCCTQYGADYRDLGTNWGACTLEVKVPPLANISARFLPSVLPGNQSLGLLEYNITNRSKYSLKGLTISLKWGSSNSSVATAIWGLFDINSMYSCTAGQPQTVDCVARNSHWFLMAGDAFKFMFRAQLLSPEKGFANTTYTLNASVSYVGSTGAIVLTNTFAI